MKGSELGFKCICCSSSKDLSELVKNFLMEIADNEIIAIDTHVDSRHSNGYHSKTVFITYKK